MSTRPFTPQLQATFIKALGDPNRPVRLVGGRGLASLSTITPKLDALLVDLAHAVSTPLGVSATTPVPISPSVGPHVQVVAAAGLYT